MNRLVAAIFVRNASYRCLATVQSRVCAQGVQHVLVGSPDPLLLPALLTNPGVHAVQIEPASALVNLAGNGWDLPVDTCDEPMLVSPGAFAPTPDAMERELRAAVVCMWSNSAR